MVAEVVRPHGIRGDLKVRVVSDNPDRLQDLDAVWVDGTRHAIEQARPHQGFYLVRLAGIDSPSAAEPFRGAIFTIPRDLAAPLDPDAYYHWQILGLAVVTTAGDHLGTVEDILETGANDVLVVTGGPKRYLIPTIAQVVQDVDLEQGRIVIEPMDGLLDL